MAFRASDARIFLRDGETAVLDDGTSFPCVLEFPDELTDLGGLSTPGQVVGKPTILYETSAVSLDAGTVVTIDGEKYAVAYTPRRRGDGVLSVADLNKAE